METTIQISKKLRTELADRKMYNNESYESVIWDLIEDTMELSEQTKKEIEIARKQVKEGKTVPFEKVMKEAGL